MWAYRRQLTWLLHNWLVKSPPPSETWAANRGRDPNADTEQVVASEFNKTKPDRGVFEGNRTTPCNAGIPLGENTWSKDHKESSQGCRGTNKERQAGITDMGHVQTITRAGNFTRKSYVTNNKTKGESKVNVPIKQEPTSQGIEKKLLLCDRDTQGRAQQRIDIKRTQRNQRVRKGFQSPSQGPESRQWWPAL